ncbi:MAG: hypothetical protein RLO50_21720 [Azospirillaceae bacterium]
MPRMFRALGATLVLIAGIGTTHAQSASHTPVHTPEWSNPEPGDPGRSAETFDQSQFQIQVATSDLQNVEITRVRQEAGQAMTTPDCRPAAGDCPGR